MRWLTGIKAMFKAKAEDEIRQEVIEDLKGSDEEFNADEHKEQIDRITQRRLKDEQFKASVHKSKEEKKTKLAELETKLKEAGPKGDEKTKTEPKFVTSEDLEKRLSKANQRAKYSWMTDEEYELVENEANRSNNKFDDTLQKNPVIKNYFNTVNIKERQRGAVGAPSNMVSQEGEPELSDVEKELSGNLPNGILTK